MSDKLFGTSGIRGSIREKITPKLALKLGLAIANQSDSTGTIAIGFDNRTSNIMLERALLSGLMAGGCDASLFGLVPLPILAFGTREVKAKSGIMITASHNPPLDNGFKIFGLRGQEYLPEQEETIEYSLKHNEPFPFSKNVGSTKFFPEITQKYIDTILEVIPPINRTIKVVIDCANGTASNVTPTILSRLGCKILSINSNIDGTFPGRPPEPNLENLSYLVKIIDNLGANIGLAHDGDADRIAVIDEDGNFVVNDRIIALFVKRKLEEHGSGTIITSIDTSRCIDDVARSLKGKIKRVKLGQTHTYFGDKNVILAAEPWKILDPTWGLWADGIYIAANLVSMLDINGPNVSDLLKDIPNYPQIRLSFPCPEPLKLSVMALIESDLPYENDIEDKWTFDGVRANYSNGSWILFRASGTEPKIRLYCEAETLSKVKDLAKKGTTLISNSINIKRSFLGARGGI